jgi:hypothetical protein
MTWYTSTRGITATGLLYRLTLWSCVCLCGGFGSNSFLTKVQPFPMDGHYRMDIISSVGYPRSDSVMLLVLCTIVMQYLGHPCCTTSPSRQRQSCLERIISQVDHKVKLLLLFMIISIYYIYIISMINCYLIMLHVLYK